MNFMEFVFLIAPAITYISDKLEGNLEINQVRLLEYKFPKEGMTLKIDITQGQLIVYGSFSIRNPTVLTADFSIKSTSKINYFISPELYSNSITVNNNISVRVYLSLIGLQINNTFSLNTTFGNTTIPVSSSGKQYYQKYLF